MNRTGEAHVAIRNPAKVSGSNCIHKLELRAVCLAALVFINTFVLIKFKIAFKF